MKIQFVSRERPSPLFRVGLTDEDYKNEFDRLQELAKKKKGNIQCLIIDRENDRLPDLEKNVMACPADVSMALFYARFRKAYSLESTNALFLMAKDEQGRYSPVHMNQTMSELPTNKHGFVDMIYCEERAFG